MNIVAHLSPDQQPRVSSRDLAAALDNQHKNVIALIAAHQALFEELGVIAFETEKPSEGSLGGRPTQTAYLNEDQCYFLLTLVRNSELVAKLKLTLVKAFAKARAQIIQPTQPAASPLALAETMLEALKQQDTRLQALEETVLNAPIRVNSQLTAQIKAACQRFARHHPRRFAGAYGAFKEAFGYQGAPLARYDDLPQSRVQEALEWLEMQIKTYSAQSTILLARTEEEEGKIMYKN